MQEIAKNKKIRRTNEANIKYYKLFDMLNRRGLKKQFLKDEAGLSPATLAKLRNGDIVTTEVISRICAALDCQPGDIMEYEKEEWQP